MEAPVKEQIEKAIQGHEVLLFMKGSPQQPMCGFSAKTAGILDSMLDGYTSVDVLADLPHELAHQIIPELEDAEDVKEKELANFCEWYSPSETAFDPQRKSEADQEKESRGAHGAGL